MANEFVARKGIISLSDSKVTGSLNVTQNVEAAGTVGGAFFQNPRDVFNTVTLPEEYNALLVGPASIYGTLNVSSGSVLNIY